MVEEIAALLRDRRVAVLTGAGISTESGIPDYRGPETRRRARSPIQYKQFVESHHHRQRYWARSTIGWPRFKAAEPNQGHHSLAQWQKSGQLTGIITQNVDRLHHQAGSHDIVELHGALAEVRCLGCRAISSRDEMQQRLEEANPNWVEATGPLAPDGDVDVEDERIRHFELPACLACGGILKPNVVFFGEGVPKPVVDRAWALFDAADALLVLGSSLAVFSGYRFVRRASKEGKPIVMINLGNCRGMDEAHIHWDAPLGTALPALVAGTSSGVTLPPSS